MSSGAQIERNELLQSRKLQNFRSTFEIYNLMKKLRLKFMLSFSKFPRCSFLFFMVSRHSPLNNQPPDNCPHEISRRKFSPRLLPPGQLPLTNSPLGNCPWIIGPHEITPRTITPQTSAPQTITSKLFPPKQLPHQIIVRYEIRSKTITPE